MSARSRPLAALRNLGDDLDADLRLLLHRRREMLGELRAVDSQLLSHGRRIANERGCKPRLTVDQLDKEFCR